MIENAKEKQPKNTTLKLEIFAWSNNDFDCLDYFTVYTVDRHNLPPEGPVKMSVMYR